MNQINDINMKNWKDYPEVLTDSLWQIDSRDNSGNHDGSYHGNFVPQIPNQLMSRFTRTGDVVLDPFMGSGTTLIEAERLGRRGIGLDIHPLIVDEVREKLSGQNQYVACIDSASWGARVCVERHLDRLESLTLI